MTQELDFKMSDSDQTAPVEKKLATVDSQIIEKAPVVPNPMVRVRVSVDDKPVLLYKAEASTDEEALAIDRRKILKQYDSGTISKRRAKELLKVKESRFYTLIRDFKQSTDYRGMVRQKRGPVIGSTQTSPELLEIFQVAYDKKYRGKRAGIAIVLDYARRLCRKKNLEQPTRHAVSKFLATKPEREKFYRKNGESKADQAFDQRDDFRDLESPLESIVMDHTQVDILLVDTVHRDVIVGRPWLTIIICAMTRVIIGYYLSLTHPNVITVQLALMSAILRKDSQYNPLQTDPEIFPFCGIPKEIYTDNAMEFLKQELIAKCARYGIDWAHRPIGKKWYGGIVERVIGTFMVRGVHFLPGATGSNVQDREGFESELNACLDILECRAWFAEKVTEYHGKKHSALKCSPRAAWTHAKAVGRDDLISLVDEDAEKSFMLDFMPSSYNHKIHPYGINFSTRRYSAPILDKYIGEECELRYNPYNLLSVWVLLEDNFHEISCVRARSNLSADWEVYNKSLWISRTHKDYKNLPDGAICDDFAFDSMDVQEDIVDGAIAKTSAYKELKLNPGSTSKQETPWLLPQPIPTLPNALIEHDAAEDNLADDLDDYKPVILIDTLDE